MTRLGFDPTRLTGLVLAGQRRDRGGVRPLDGPPLLHRTGIGPWGGEVRVEAWATRLGKTFRVIAQWTGPPLAGAEPSAEPVHASDFVDVDDQQEAMRIARTAIEALGRPQRPTLHFTGLYGPGGRPGFDKR